MFKVASAALVWNSAAPKASDARNPQQTDHRPAAVVQTRYETSNYSCTGSLERFLSFAAETRSKKRHELYN